MVRLRPRTAKLALDGSEADTVVELAVTAIEHLGYEWAGTALDLLHAARGRRTGEETLWAPERVWTIEDQLFELAYQWDLLGRVVVYVFTGWWPLHDGEAEQRELIDLREPEAVPA